jgi:hypothetical protein
LESFKISSFGVSKERRLRTTRQEELACVLFWNYLRVTKKKLRDKVEEQAREFTTMGDTCTIEQSLD